MNILTDSNSKVFFIKDEVKLPKLFMMIRNEKVIAWGVEFNDGSCVVHWEGEYQSTVYWKTFDDLVKVNGHGNMTRFVFYNVDTTKISVLGPNIFMTV